MQKHLKNYSNNSVNINPLPYSKLSRDFQAQQQYINLRNAMAYCQTKPSLTKPSSREDYAKKMTYFFKFLPYSSAGLLQYYSFKDFREHLDSLEMKATSKNNLMVITRGYLKHLYQVGIISKDITIPDGFRIGGFETGKDNQRTGFTSAEITRIFKALEESENHRLRLIFYLAYYQGLRVSSIHSLNVDSIDVKTSKISYRQKKRDSITTKSINSEKLIRAYKLYMKTYTKKAGSNALFIGRSGRMSQKGIQKMIYRFFYPRSFYDRDRAFYNKYYKKQIKDGIRKALPEIPADKSKRKDLLTSQKSIHNIRTESALRVARKTAKVLIVQQHLDHKNIPSSQPYLATLQAEDFSKQLKHAFID